MTQVTIYGASDDLIEVEGPGALSQEFDVYDRAESTLTFDDGTKVGIEYAGRGLWKVRVKELAGATVVSHFEATDPDGDQYSDKLVLEGEFSSVKCRKGRKGRSLS